MAKREKVVSIVGRVVNSVGGEDVAGLRVEAWDKDLVCDDMVGSALTDARGEFRMEFDAAHFAESFLDRSADLFFKVFRDGSCVRSTEDSVLWNVEAGATEVVIEVETPRVVVEVETPREQPREVRGTVRLADASPARGVTVSAFDRDLRSEQLLGQSPTGDDGAYSIRYSAEQFRKREKGGADLVVKAASQDGVTLAASPVLFNAPPIAEVALVIPAEAIRPPSLFEKIGAALEPLLEGLKPEELEEDAEHQDLSFLAGETGFERSDLARFAAAHRLGRQAVRAEFWFALLGGSPFRFSAGASPTEQAAHVLDSLPSLDAEAVRKSLAVAIGRGDISEAFRERLDEWVEAFERFAASRLVSREAAPTFVRLALEDAGVKGTEEQEKFARLFVEHEGLTPELLDALDSDESFSREAVADLRTSFRLAELTRGDISVVRLLKNEFGIHEPEKIRTLAKRDENELVEVVAAGHEAGKITLPFAADDAAAQAEMPAAEVYGRTLARQFREAFPTAAFVGGLERAARDGGARGLRHAEALGRFLDSHENFELLSTSVGEFLGNGINKEFERLARDEEFRLEVKAVQRVFKLAPTFEAAHALLADGVHSAQQVYRMGESEFVRRYAGGATGLDAAGASVAWNRAAATQAAALNIVADLKSFEAGASPLALKTAGGSAALSTFPNWNSLFQSGDLCECKHCRSVLSPAAYFADLLMFLGERKAADLISTVRDVLFRRRPDLGYIELNCENALTPLPYIDVVCEVLEAVIAEGADDRELNGLTSIPDNSAATKSAVAGHGLGLGADFSLSQVDPLKLDLWVAHGDDATYLLKKKMTANFFAQILPNTKVSAEELRARPQYVNPEAYKKLRQARHPLTLPFDLFAEEVRAAMQKTNLRRWELMRTLRGASAPNDPTDGDIAAEYFGISSDPTAPFDEKRLITDANTLDAGQQVIWGETANAAAWLNSVGNVKNFLRKTGLKYDELLTLLDLEFINPARDIAVHHLDASCDTDKKVIQVLDATKLDRIHRFLRLWRKLAGWKVWELDLAVRHPRLGNGVLDEAFLINLFHFSEVKRKLGSKTTVEQALALFGDLNKETRFTRLHEKREDGLYQRLFLNGKLTKPLDPAFEVAAVDVPAPTAEKISGHRSVVLAALGVRDADLVVLEGLTKASNGAPYITDDLTLGNLSFLWRHAWLSKALKFKAEGWKTLLKVLDEDVSDFATPADALAFLEKVEQVAASGFTPDELSWLLAADRSAKAAVKEADAARFLTTLRKELQAIRAAHDPAQYAFLSAAPPTDADSLTALLTSLLQRLGRDEEAALFFVATLADEVTQERPAPDLPAGFDFPAHITDDTLPSFIPISYEPRLRFDGVMTAQQKLDLTSATNPLLAAVAGLPAYKQAIKQLFEYPGQTAFAALPAGFDFPPNITNVNSPDFIPISYKPVLRFKGLMTATQKAALLDTNDASLAGVTGVAGYQNAVAYFFDTPRLAMKFFEPVFTSPLENLPAGVDFKTLADPTLARKISYDAEQRVLRFDGVMSDDDRAALDELDVPNNVDYSNALNSLFTQPRTGVFPAEVVWLEDTDLQFPLRDPDDPAGDNLALNLAAAVTKALAYLSKVLSESAVLQQVSAKLKLQQPLARLLLMSMHPAMNDTLMDTLAGAFAATTGVVSYSTSKPLFNYWFWAGRVAALWLRWKLTPAEVERVLHITATAQLLDFATMPFDDAATVASADEFLRTSRLLKLRDTLPEDGITLLEVLEKLNAGAYGTTSTITAAFAAALATNVERVNGDWSAANVEQLVLALDLVPADYLLAESWERLRRAFRLLDGLNADAGTGMAFAAAAMSDQDAATLRRLLRSKFGDEAWLSLSGEIQDVLRERKSEALVSYLLAGPQPPDAPSGRWETTNDLYAYYLLDVEMCACMQTSRLVQAAGSVQLFVQRCHMGLEPDVEVKTDGPTGDSAWRWWSWMRKYRVWEANRKVFLWPENWLAPELRQDKSQFFKELEDELLQNEITERSAESALHNYLEKLDGVSRLEVAGFYHEDDGDEAIIHVFGRTSGAEPHLYYYRRFDYRRWTPWEEVKLDIQGDYLIPAVVGGRLFLFWPVFKETPDEQGNNENIPLPASGATEAAMKKTLKVLELKLAASEYQQGAWKPKRVSKDSVLSDPYDSEIARKHYRFYFVDRTSVEGRVGVRFEGFSLGSDGRNGLKKMANLSGAFEIAGCKGVPELAVMPGSFRHVVRPEVDSTGEDPALLKWEELDARADAPANDFSLSHYAPARPELPRAVPVLGQTPWTFQVTPPWQLSYFDAMLLDGLMLPNVLPHIAHDDDGEPFMPAGIWLPFFYADKKRAFYVLPTPGRTKDGAPAERGVRDYYPDVKRSFREQEDRFRGELRGWLEGFRLDALTPDQRRQIELFLWQSLPAETPPPYADEQLKALLERHLMRPFHQHLGGQAAALFTSAQFHFRNFYHPFVCEFIRLVTNPLRGIPTLMSRETQARDGGFSFRQSYQPTPRVVEPPTEAFYPKEVVDFTPDGAYSSYNWELFFHAPLLIANSLSANQRFEEAQRWYHFIFNPVGTQSAAPGGSPSSRYWKTWPFYQTTTAQYLQQRIDNILRLLAGDTTLGGSAARAELEAQVRDSRTHPFDPHRIAAYRLTAYQKAVVMKYLDNLIAWGDYLFRQDSMESINEATQLYVLAAEILGPPPAKMPPRAKPPLESFNELKKEFDKFSNALVEVENLVPQLSGAGQAGADPAPLPTLYFCIPHNDKMLGYWDTVADRLYKIRHCMNIEGVVRQPALFEPPIDPGLLVKAVAGGLDIGAALADMNAPLPLYRFDVLLRTANEVCADVKALGGALLSALEKKDAEELGLLRQSQELRMLEAVRAVREKQIAEAKENLEALLRSKAITEVRLNYYRNIVRITPGEQLSLDKQKKAFGHQQRAQQINIAASILGYLPNVTVGASGFGGSPHVNVQWGTGNIISALQAAAGVETHRANAAGYEAGNASTLAGYERRADDWDFQARLAEKELVQLDSQIAAARLRVALAEKEFENHALQIENAKETDAFMRSKYTGEELYRWQVAQISGVYFQNYRLAYELAKRAERCFRFELGLRDSSYVSFGYWDSLKMGLHSGDRLQLDLRRLEVAYREQNRREYELTKHVSLAQLDPLALLRLRETGRCFFSVPEELFDLDYPGHYFRRIKSFSLTLPCVAGPYTTISCTLRLLGSSIRVSTADGDNGYARNTDEQGLPADDERFVENNVPVKAIATSRAQNDNGVFELSFRDERYLPFEGAGAVSLWSLELFTDLPSNNPDPANPDFGRPLRQFDYGTISDVVLHVMYTAREDAGPFKNGAIAHLREHYFAQEDATPALRLLNLREEFPAQWSRFLNPPDVASLNLFEFEMEGRHFSLKDAGKTLSLNKVWLLARGPDGHSYAVDVTLQPPSSPIPLEQIIGNRYGDLSVFEGDLEIALAPSDPPLTWQLEFKPPQPAQQQATQITGFEDLFLVVGYAWA